MMAVAEAFVKSSYSDRTPTTFARVVDDGKAVEVTLTAKANTYFPGPIAQGVSEVKAVVKTRK